MLPLLIGLLSALVVPSDHGDTPLLVSIARPDARITDLHVFTRGDDLVLSLCVNPAVPPGATGYVWPSDVSFDINIDSHADVTFDDPTDLATFGGTIQNPGTVRPRVVIRIRADAEGNARAFVVGPQGPALQRRMTFFAGLRDDPFIRGPRIGRNVAAAVVSLPLSRLQVGHRPLLVWATASIDGRPEPFQDLAGRSLRSMFPESDFLNAESPRDHWLNHGVAPDVVIYDPARPAAYPNGRELADDVADQVGDPRILGNDAPFPSENDVPFLAEFPYLAPPQ